MQKIDEKSVQKAKIIFEEYLKQNNIIHNAEKKLKKIYSKNKNIKIKYLLNNLDNIFTCNPTQINLHITKLKQIKNKEIKIYFENLYKKFTNKEKGKAYEIIQAFGIRACPYCNLNYVDSVMDEKQKILRPHLDHYYSKSLYPYLALSFYNLIPSCPACNSSLKLDKDFFISKHIYPHLDSFDDNAEIVIKIKDINTLYDDINSFTLDINPIDKFTEIKHATETFKLVERYNLHRDIAQELLVKKKIYTKEYIAEITGLLKSSGVADFSQSAIELFLTGNYTNSDDINKRPLAKLTKDIWNG